MYLYLFFCHFDNSVLRSAAGRCRHRRGSHRSCAAHSTLPKTGASSVSALVQPWERGGKGVWDMQSKIKITKGFALYKSQDWLSRTTNLLKGKTCPHTFFNYVFICLSGALLKTLPIYTFLLLQWLAFVPCFMTLSDSWCFICFKWRLPWKLPMEDNM